MNHVYAEFNPKNTFIYLALEMPRLHVDVNVHPTKREVGFLHEEAIVAAVCRALRALLVGSNSSRAFPVQYPP